jgi:hypothetical protein
MSASISPAKTAGSKIPIIVGAGGTTAIESAFDWLAIPMPLMSNAKASRLRRKMKSLLE